MPFTKFDTVPRARYNATLGVGPKYFMFLNATFLITELSADLYTSHTTADDPVTKMLTFSNVMLSQSGLTPSAVVP